MEIVVLKYKPGSQETKRLLDDCLPGSRTLTGIHLALVVNIESSSRRQRDELIGKAGGIHLEDSLPRLDIFARRIPVFPPLPGILWQRHFCGNRCRSVSCDHPKGRRLSVPVAQLLQEFEPMIKVRRIPWHWEAQNFAFVRSILCRELIGPRAFLGPRGRKKAGVDAELYPFL